MDEFLNLFLTGRRADDLKKFRRFRMVIGLLGALLAVIPVFINLFGAENAPLCIVLTVLGFLLESAAAVLSFVQKKYIDALVELESAAIEIEKRGEERDNYRKLYAAWRETFGKRDVRQILSVVFAVLGFSILAAAVLFSTYMELPQFVLPLACIVAAIVAAVPSMLQATGEGKARTRLYELAGREIDEIKRTKLGVSEQKIMAEEENARGFSMLPVPVTMFLKEETEREEFRTVNKRSSMLSFFLGLVLGGAVVVGVIMGAQELDPAISWTVALVTFVLWGIVFFALLLPLEGKKKAIYKRNGEKLTDSRADQLRRSLQGAWIAQQRRGNIMFLCFLLTPLLIGVVYGTIGYVMYREQFLIVAIGSSFLAFLFPAAVVSFVIWTIMYAVYRKRVRPLEAELQKILEEERQNERQG